MKHLAVLAHSSGPRWLVSSCTMALALSLTGMTSVAHAQDAAPQTPPDAQAAEPASPDQDIVVTGSRLGVGFSAPTPVTSVGAQQIEDRALTSIAELNYEIPQLRVNQNVGKSSEPVGQNQLDLRALGSARTLVLLDGRRLAATSPFGGIDSNIFPVALISSIDIVTGGASAAYGSDAVAGVVNFGLKKDFVGLKLDASYGTSDYNDFHRPVISGAVGTTALDGRLHLSGAGEFYRNTGQTRVASRPWGRNSPILFANPTFTTTNGQTRNYIANDGRLVGSFGGLVLGNNADTNPANGADVLRGIQFGPGGTVIPYNYGSVANTTFQLGGDGVTIEDDGNLLPYITRYSGYGRASFDATDDLTFWTDLLYSRVTVFSDLAPNYDQAGTALTIQRDNAYLPSTVRNLMLANNISSFRLSRINLEDGPSQNNSRTRALRYAAGVQGKLGDGWDWDAFVQRSDNRFFQEAVNNRIQANWFAGVDSVISPATGQAVCRVNADASTTNDRPGCIPINVFGAGSISQAALGWYRGTSFYSARMTQNNYGVNVRGRPFSTWAGEVSVAFGGEHRDEGINSISDPISIARGWRSVNQQPFSGRLHVSELYLETAVPLAKDMAFAENLELNGAVRYADYSSSGGVTTWKVGVNYSPIADVRFRGTISRDIRAANINELFAGQNQVINSISDGRPGFAPAYNVLQLTGGNRNLAPERADTKSVGVVLQPSFLPGFNMSVDYYNIKIKGQISAIAPQTIATGCLISRIPELCQFVNFGPSNEVQSIIATLVNNQEYKTSGVDFEMAYRRPVSWFGAEGTIGSRLLVNYVHDLKLTVPPGVTTSNLGDISADPGGQPRWKWNFDLTYAGGPVRLGLYARYIGGGKFRTIFVDDVDLPASQNNVSGRTYIDMSASYKITEWLEIYGKVDNIFNKAPPIIPNAIIQPTVSNSQMYDKIGRYYVGGVRLRF